MNSRIGLSSVVAALMAIASVPTIPGASMQAADAGARQSVHDFTMKSIDGTDVPLSHYRGKVLLIVNVASQCGYTPQYKNLETLFRTYKDRGFVVLGFPANNFGSQEPGTEAEIKQFCTTTYNVTFDMFSKISVTGDDQHPLYRYLTSERANPSTAGPVRWNFQKYLIDKNGRVVGMYVSRIDPMSTEVTSAVEAALAK